jgi:hypothetical protein
MSFFSGKYKRRPLWRMRSKKIPPPARIEPSTFHEHSCVIDHSEPLFLLFPAILSAWTAMEKDDERPQKRRRLQSTLGSYFLTTTGASLAGPVDLSRFLCPACSKDCKNSAGLIVHKKFCPKLNQDISPPPEFLGSFRALFPLPKIPELNVEQPVVAPVDLQEESEDAMDVDEEPNPVTPTLSKRKRKRHRYSNRFIVSTIASEGKVRVALGTYRNVPPESFTQAEIVEIMNWNTGVPTSVLCKWLHDKEKHIARHQRKRDRKRKNFGSGRKPTFPLTEASVAADAKSKRDEGRLVGRHKTIEKIKEGARNENPVAFTTFHFDYDYLLAFLGRNGLSLRMPSCTKPMTLELGIRISRGYFQWFLKVIKDDIGDGIKRARVMHPTQGRFPFDCRYNKDEILSILRFFSDYI